MAKSKRPKSLFEGLINASDSLVQRAAKTLREEPHIYNNKEDLPEDHSVDHRDDYPVGHSVDYRGVYSTVQSIVQPVQIPTKIPSDPPTQKPSEIPTKIPSDPPTQKPSEIPTNKVDQSSMDLPTLVENEVVLYYCLKYLKGQTTTMSKIHQATNISTDTLRGCLKRLRKKEMIAEYGGLKNEAGQVGFSAKIAEKQFLLRGDQERLKHKLDVINYTHLPIISNHVIDQLDNQLLNSSSSFFSKETTTVGKVENILNSDPELGYWRQKGLTSKQMKDWIKITVNLENLTQSLCHCRYEMVDMNLEESKPIDNVFNWFFKIIEKAGSYPKPKGYKSFEDKQIEQERVAIEEKEKRIEEMKALSRKKWELERDETFWEMMTDSESKLYKECYGNLNNFAKKSKGKVLESSMRSSFDKIMNDSDKGI
jgi:hypothetical protein